MIAIGTFLRAKRVHHLYAWPIMSYPPQGRRDSGGQWHLRLAPSGRHEAGRLAPAE
jgi:hypothetical protein